MLVVVILHIFQFHKGAIRTVDSPLTCNCFIDFNSIKVRLELGSSLEAIRWQEHFNSIKVRLERLFWVACRMLVEHFNSIKVRLELSG